MALPTAFLGTLPIFLCICTYPFPYRDCISSTATTLAARAPPLARLLQYPSMDPGASPHTGGVSSPMEERERALIDNRVSQLENNARHLERRLEEGLQALAKRQEEYSKEVNHRLEEEGKDPRHQQNKLMEGIQISHRRIWEGTPTEPALAYDMMLLKRGQEQRGKILWWLMGLISSGALLTLGNLL